MNDDNNNRQTSRKKRKENNDNHVTKEEFEEMIKSHEQFGWNVNNIPKWSEDSIFIPSKVTCPNAGKNVCIVCQKFCFSEVHRGNPVRDINWFTSSIDATFVIATPQAKALNKLQKDLTKWLRADELQLRMISRRERTMISMNTMRLM